MQYFIKYFIRLREKKYLLAIFRFALFIEFVLLLTLNGFGQSFTKVISGSIVTDGGSSFGGNWGDYNNDGYLDLFVANGGADGVDENNFLYLNNQDGSFTKITDGEIVTDGGISNGSGWGDFDNNGDLDLFVSNRDGQNNFLYFNNGDGTFSKISTGAVVNDGGNSNNNTCIDYDNDGRLDIYVSNFATVNFLYKNNGGGTFTSITTGGPVNDISNSISDSWGDADNDGDLDLFIANAASSGPNNLFYLNNGDGTFNKITTGNIVNDGGTSMSGSWGDYDNDGDLDLFVCNQLNQNNFLYQNNGDGTFNRITNGEIVNDSGWSISALWADYDNDGDLDLFITNWQGQANFLYENNGPPDYSFTKITGGVPVNDLGDSFGASWGDYDNDGDLDLFVANRGGANNYLYRNDGNNNHWVNIVCKGTNSNAAAIGAKIRLKATIDGQVVWQLREISGQMGYNSQNSLRAFFGLKDTANIDSLIIEWPSGVVDKYTNLSADQFLKAVEGQGISPVTGIEEKNSSGKAGEFGLLQNYPNPFNPSTTIEYRLPQAGNAMLKIYDNLGQVIRTLVNDRQQAGLHRANWDGRDARGVGAPSGIYFYTLQTAGFSDSGKMTLVR
jgi:hypothetical protein